MAHFAELNSENEIVRVIVVDNKILRDIDDVEHESCGIDFCRRLFGDDTRWVQCSYNHNFRKQFPGKGYTYDSESDVFVAPKPYDSWNLNSNHEWEPPVPYPTSDSNDYFWNEETQSWVTYEI